MYSYCTPGASGKSSVLIKIAPQVLHNCTIMAWNIFSLSLALPEMQGLKDTLKFKKFNLTHSRSIIKPSAKFRAFWCFFLLTKVKVDPESLSNKLSNKQLRKKEFPRTTSYDQDQKYNFLIFMAFKCCSCKYPQPH